MKILLVRPKPDRETIGLQSVMICEPLELEYIGAYLIEHGHDVEIADMIIEKRSINKVVADYQPDLVGITAYISHVNIVKAYSKTIKQDYPDLKIAAGGVHAEVVPEDFEHPAIDYVITANGIKTVGELVCALQKGDSTDGIEGIWRRGKKRAIKETTFDYPHPARQLVNRYRKHYYYMFHNPCALMKTSYGCPYSCKFCFCRVITDGCYFTRSLEDIISELKAIPEKEIYIVDDDFMIDAKRIKKFCQILKKEKIDKHFLLYTRADFIASHEEIIAMFSDVGLRAVIVGLESSRESELETYNKKSSVAINEHAVNILKKHGVECYATLILGTDWTSADFDNLYRWLIKLDLKFVNLQPFTPIPGTELYDDYSDQLIIPREQFEKWDLAHLVVKPGAMSISRYYFEIIKLYYKITMRPKSVYYMLKKYGLVANIKLSWGAWQITKQYIVKMLRGAH